MIQVTEKSQCSGCTACFAACPHQCIEMEKDEEGFLYPRVLTDECIECRICEKVCPVLNFENFKDSFHAVYGAVNKNEIVHRKSSSGGIFTLLAEEIIQSGGIVCGAAMSEDHYSVQHIIVNDIQGLDKLRGSKYVQSIMGNCFADVKKALQGGKLVYFTGTPCQIAGLKNFLGKQSRWDNLYTQDIVCHGTPSPVLWEQYLKFREKKAGDKADTVSFRYKKTGEKEYSLRIVFENRKEYCKTKSEDLYLRAYLSNIFLKPACYHCKFKSIERDADITLADFWGVKKYSSKLGDMQGVSLVAVHSMKGKKLFDNIKDKMIFEKVNDEPLKFNSCSIESVNCPKQRNKFWADFSSKDFEKFMKDNFSVSMDEKVKKRFKKILKKVLIKK